MSNPTGTKYLQANSGYVWADGDVYEIPQTDDVEGAASGASFSGLGVENQPHQKLLNKIQWLYTRITSIPHGMTVLTAGSGNFIVPAYVTGIWVRAWGKGGDGGRSVSGVTFGGGGGGGAYLEGVVTVTAGQSIAWSVSSLSSIFGTWTAGAGSDGQAGSLVVPIGPAGAGGLVLGTPSLALRGMGGETGRSFTISGVTTVILGEGGASFGSGHSHFGWLTPGLINGIASSMPGQGGQGSCGGGAGGLGGPGMIIVQW